MDWHQIKEWLSAATGLDMDALHVHLGVLCQISAALLLRRRLSSPWPWLAVLAVTLGNEFYDYNYEIWPERAMQRAESLKDIWNTMLLPSVLFLLARTMPRLFAAPVPEASADDPG